MRLSDLTEPGDGLTIAVLDYGIGNLRSAQKALQRLGATALLTADPATIESADGVVLPGVGAFGACMDALDATGLTEQSQLVAGSGRPFLGICVGMQVMFAGSDETPGRSGLGLFSGTIRRLTGEVRIPQMQWNKLEVTAPEHPLMNELDGSWMYFVHSYGAEETNDTIAVTEYGGRVVAAVAKDNVWATQFHPEKSADDGKRLLTNWLEFVAASRLVVQA
jgi:glutamine amidotransferase